MSDPTQNQNQNDVTANNPPTERGELIRLRPTLFIGMGGTGMEVLLRLRRRILNTAWGNSSERIEGLTDFPVAEFIHFDLDHGAITDSGRAQSEDLQFEQVRFSDEEKLIESFDIEHYSRDDDSLSRFPHIKEWLPLTPKRIRDLGIDPAKGAGQIRAISRLYFFDKYARLREQIRNKLRSLRAGLSHEEQLRRLGLELDQQKFRVVVIGSVAGGTGSGSFLDMGWLAGWQARSEVGSADTELMLLMPTGFAGANKLRTEANGYAALMELEAAMRGNSGYVTRWDKHDQPQLAPKPYDEIFLVDTGNLARQTTKNITDVYHMVADTLFEDFASADFANRKRSVAVNQRQHKTYSYSPDLPERFSSMRLAFSRSYSAFGQAMLDTQQELRADMQAHRLASSMLRAFFGVMGGDASALRATTGLRDDFMHTHLLLSASTFSDLPKFSSPAVKLTHSTGEFSEFHIVENLLSDRQGPLVADVQQRVNARLEDIRNNFARSEWGVQISEALRLFERDVMRDVNSGSDVAEDRIARAREERLASLSRQIREQLFSYLDNKEYGGLEFVLSLVEQVKDRLENAETGVIQALERNATRYEEIRDAIRTHEYERLMNNLGQIGRGVLGGLFGGGDSQAASVVGHLGEEIANLLKFHLRAKAAREAAALMREISTRLGVRQGVDENGQPLWSGIVGEFQVGRSAVLAMLQRLERSLAILGQDLSRDHATLITIPAPELHQHEASGPELRQWADEAFENFGGSRELFPRLANPEERPRLIATLIRAAQQRLASAGVSTAASDEEPLIEALQNLSPSDRKRTFTDLMQRAMPWVDGNLDGLYKARPDQFKCLLGVARAAEFKKRFLEEIRACIPAGMGITSTQIDVLETGKPGHAVCYTEISGIPLTVMRGLETWQTSYRQESEQTPVHTHIDITRFVHPLAPSNESLRQLADDFKVYLQAVLLGVLRRAPQHSTPPGQYQFDVALGDTRRIGNERAFRLNGLPAVYRETITARVEEAIDALNGAQCAALSALAQHCARVVYEPPLHTDETGTETPRPSFAHAIALETAGELAQRALRKGLAKELDDTQRHRLLEAISAWTDPIADSDADALPWEVREGEAHGRPRLKRTLRRTPDALSAIEAAISGGAAAISPLASSPVPPPPPGLMYHVSVSGQTSGPFPAGEILQMSRSGQLSPASTHVWREGFPAWQLLAECAELRQPAPPPPPLF